MDPGQRGLRPGLVRRPSSAGPTSTRNGELRVALRSALVDESRVQLFSGAGIVADSDPDDELAETGVKLRALLDVMESAQ